MRFIPLGWTLTGVLSPKTNDVRARVTISMIARFQFCRPLQSGANNLARTRVQRLGRIGFGQRMQTSIGGFLSKKRFMNKETACTVSALVFSLMCAAAILPFEVNAHEGATGIVKERMDAMKEMGDSMKVMGDMVKGKRPFESEAFVEGSRVVTKNSPQIPRLFPEGSGGGKSEAVPRIWREWEQFEALAERTAKEAETLNELSTNGADSRILRKQFVILGKSCKSCHTDYRKKKEKR